MNCKLLLFLCLSMCLAVDNAMASHVDEAKAREVASRFIRSSRLKTNMSFEGKMTEVAKSASYNEFYIFCGSGNQGFVIVSADDCVQPILGYSEESLFDVDNIPDVVRWWLDRYEEEIRQCRTTCQPDERITRQWERLLTDTESKDPTAVPVVGPLLTTRWGQDGTGSPTYNKFCPQTNTGIHALTGCVATAGAQIMKYWNHPHSGRGSETYIVDGNPYTGSPDFGGVTLTADFANTIYDWDNMPEALYPATSPVEEIDAVATLIYHVGVAVHMIYGVNVSGAHLSGGNNATGASLEAAFRNHFKYSNTVCSVEESQFDHAEWVALLKSELNAERPMAYAGGDHAFVCDGYDSEDLFHFNWGWKGLYDGYYAIGSLNPGSHSFNFHCEAIIGIQPQEAEVPENGQTIITVEPNYNVAGEVTGSGIYPTSIYHNYQPASIGATPKLGFRFVQWNDQSRYTNRVFLALGGDIRYTAIFEEDLDNPVIGYDNYTNYTSSGSFYIPTSQRWGIRLSPELLANASELVAVQIRNYQAATLSLYIYSGGTTPNEDNLIYSQPSNHLPSGGISVIDLTTPVSFDPTQPLWIIFQAEGSPYRMYRYQNEGVDDAIGWIYNDNGWEQGQIYPIQGVFNRLPHAPVENLQANVLSNGNVQVTWSAPTLLTPIGYTIALGTIDDPYLMDAIDVSSTSHTFTMDESVTSFRTITPYHLVSNTSYRVFVRARYANPSGGEYHGHWREAEFSGTFRYSQDSCVIVATAADETTGIVTGGGVYLRGEIVTIEAIPMIGYYFEGWNDNYGIPFRTFTATTDAAYTAIFSPQMYEMSVVCDETRGTVAVDGVTPTIINGRTCYPVYSTITLTATPFSGYQFDRWSDGITTNPRYITLLYNFEVGAQFIVDDNSKGYHLYPSHNQVRVHTQQAAPLWIYDMLGRCHYSGRIEPENITTVKLPRAGVYLVKIGNHTPEKIVIM